MKTRTSSGRPSAHLKTLGALRLTVGAETVSFPTQKVAVLLAYLLARSRPTPRRDLIDFLWPKAKAAKGRHSLAQSLYSLKRLLGANVLNISNNEVAISDGVVATDLNELLLALRDRDLAAAGKLYEGSFLEGIEIQGAPLFLQWKESTDAHLFHNFRELAIARLRSERPRNDWRSAAKILSIVGQCLPDDPVAGRLRAELLLQHKHDDEARVLFEHMLRIHAELEYDYQELVQSALALQSAVRRDTTIFVGRTNELESVRSSWTKARFGKGALIVVSGPPGVGKTVFCQQIVQQVARTADARILEAKAYPAVQYVGYATLADALKSGLSERDLSCIPPVLAKAITQVLPEWEDSSAVSTPPLLVGEAAQRRVFEAVVQLIENASRTRPSLIVFDDTQWADIASIRWAAYCARRISRMAVLMILVVRSSHTAALFHQFKPLDPEHAHVIELRDFDDSELRALADTFDRSFTKETELQLKKATGGRPVLAIEWLTQWQTGNPTRNGLPFVEEALNQATPLARSLGQLLAIAARPMDLGLLSDVTSQSPGNILSALSELEDLITTKPQDVISFRHDLVRERVCDSLPPLTSKQLHAHLAETLVARGDPPSTIAYHFSESGNASSALRYALEAAAECELRHAYGEAEHYLNIALRNCTDATKGDSIRERTAQMLMRTQRFRDAEILFKALADAAVSNDKELLYRSQRIACAVAAASTPADTLLADLAQLEEDALALKNPEVLRTALRDSLRVATMAGLLDGIDARINRLLEVAEQYPITAFGVDALRIAGHATAMTSSPISAVPICRSAASWADQLKDTELQIEAYSALGTVCYDAGDFLQAIAAHDRVLDIIAASGAVSFNVVGYLRRAAVILELGRDIEAESHLEMALDMLRDSGAANDRAVAYANLAMVQFQRENFVHAIEQADKALAVELIGQANAPHLFARGIRGLSYIELGNLNAAGADAARVRIVLGAQPVQVGDISPAVLLIARSAVFHRQESKVRQLIETLLTDAGPKDLVSRLRIQIAFAEVVAHNDNGDGADLIQAVIRQTSELGLWPSMKLAERAARRIGRFKARRSP